MDRLTEALPTAMDSRESLPGTQTQRDAEILKSLPGVGRIVLATLLAEAHDPLRRRDYQALRCLSGVAPVTKRSGKSLIVIGCVSPVAGKFLRACIEGVFPSVHVNLRAACLSE